MKKTNRKTTTKLARNAVKSTVGRKATATTLFRSTRSKLIWAAIPKTGITRTALTAKLRGVTIDQVRSTLFDWGKRGLVKQVGEGPNAVFRRTK